MTQYNFKIVCEDAVLNGTVVSNRARSESAAREAIRAKLKEAARVLPDVELEMLGTGNLTPLQIAGGKGGRKSRRSITPEQQAKMQAGRRKERRVHTPGEKT